LHDLEAGGKDSGTSTCMSLSGTYSISGFSYYSVIRKNG